MSEGDMNDPNNINGSPDDGADMSRVYAATARDEPPAALDDAILAKARSAIVSDAHGATGAETRGEAQGKSYVRKGSRQWIQHFAIAATLVVTASLVVLMEKEQPQIGVLAPPASDAAVAPTEKSSTDAVKAREVPPRIARMEAQPRASVNADRPDRDRPTERIGREREQISPAPEQPASPASQLADAVKADTPAPERQAFPAGAPARPAALARAESSMQASSAAPPAASGTASGGALAERRELQSAEAVARAPANTGTAKKDESPEAWLARIAELRKQGRIKEAEENLSEFIKRYPQYKLPSTIIEYQK
jgi:hypothetical protein